MTDLVSRRFRHDVMFYLPSITPLLTGAADRAAGGAETQILLVARALAARGLRVCIVAFPGNTPVPGSVDGVNVFVRAPHRGGVRLLGKVLEAWHIWRAFVVVDARTAVVRVAGTQVGLIALISKLGRRRFVYSSAHVFDFETASLGMKRRDLAIYKLGLRLADEIVVQTDEQVSLCVKHFRRVPTLIRSVAELAEPARVAESIVWIGRLVWYKRPLVIIELAKRLPHIPFRMVGVVTEESGTLADTVADAAQEAPNVELLGAQPRADVLELIRTAVAVVNTSLSEGMSNILLEAWSRGVPALVLSHDPDELIERFGLGTVAHGSVDTLADAVSQAWADRDQAPVALTAERCRNYIQDYHSPARIVGEWEVALGLIGPSYEDLQVRELGAC